MKKRIIIFLLWLGFYQISFSQNLVDISGPTLVYTCQSQPIAYNLGYTDPNNGSLYYNCSASNFNVSINGGGIVQSNSPAGTAQITWNTPGNYTISVVATQTCCSYDSNFEVIECSSIDIYGTLNVTVLAPPVVPVVNNSIGFGSVNLQVQNPNSNFQYRWYNSTSETFVSGTTPVGNSLTFIPTTNLTSCQTKTFYVAAFVNGCSESARTAVTAYYLPAYNAVNSNPTATLDNAGTSVTLSLNPTAGSCSFGAPTAYLWRRNGIIVGNAATYTANQSGSYTCTLNFTVNSTPVTYTTPPLRVQSVFQASNRSFVVTHNIRKSGVTNSFQIGQITAETERTRNITYLDDLGRPIQSIEQEGSPTKKDVVKPIAYDALGRENKKYPAYSSSVSTGVFQGNALTANQGVFAFYNNSANVSTTTTFPFAETRFENSPLSRPLEQGSVGLAWQINPTPPNPIKTIEMAYRSNTAGDQVIIWNYTPDAVNGNFRTITTNANQFYAAGALDVSEVKDEDNRPAWEFKNRAGQTILKRVQANIIVPPATTTTLKNLDTYYVYDDLGNLRALIPPQAVEEFHTFRTQNPAVSPVFYDATNVNSPLYPRWHALIYRTNYDNLNRVIEQWLPGVQESVWTIYDAYNRPIMTQDGVQRTANKWSFAKFDYLGRSILSGEITYSTNLSRSVIQSAVDTYYQNLSGSATVQLFESRKAAGANVEQGYSNNQAYPCICGVSSANPSAIDLQKVSYYDDYDFDNNGTADFSFVNLNGRLDSLGSTIADNSASLFLRLREATTGSKVKILNPDAGMPTWLATASFYDREGRVIQLIGENHLGGRDITTTYYNFDGQLSNTHYQHRVLNQRTLEIRQDFTYDDHGRQLNIHHKVGRSGTNETNLQATAPAINVSENNYQTLARFFYNEAGELNKKNVGAVGTPTAPAGSPTDVQFLQNIDYKYNERGWLTAVNQMTLDATNRDLFGMEFFYNQTGGLATLGLSATPQFDGSLAAVQWKSASDGILRGYAYQYDELNQLSDATFQQSGSSLGEQFNLSGLRYDLNGNLVQMRQNGLLNFNHSTGTAIANPSFGQMDNLTYSYNFTDAQGRTVRGNQLRAVTDAATSTGQAGDFRRQTTNGFTEHYLYDANGNLSQDLNKGITLNYNSLDLTRQVNIGTGAGMYSNYSYNFVYDAVGNKLRTTLKDGSGTTVVQYDYIGGMVYLSDASTMKLQSISHSEGRLLTSEFNSGIVGNAFVYEYFYTDHQGNTRIVFRDLPNSPSFLAKMNVIQEDENQGFKNIASTRFAGEAFEGTGSARVNNSQQMGPMISLQVSKGDIVNANVMAKYKTTETQTTQNLTVFLNTQLNGGTAVNPNGIDRPLNSANDYAFLLGVGIPLANTADPTNNQTNGKAYLRYVFYSKAGHFLSSKTVSLANGITTYTNLPLPQLTAPEEGYVQVFVANESDRVAYFDNLQVNLTLSKLNQENHYSPFGLNLVGIEKPGRPEHRWQYQGKEKLNEAGLMYYDFGSRIYDAQLGRWQATDPQNQFASPYNGMGNNWVNGVDPNGEFAWFVPLIFAGVQLGADAIRGDINSFGDAARSFGLGLIQGTLAAATGGTSYAGSTGWLVASSQAISSQLPGVSVPIGGNASINISPSFVIGTGHHGFSFGANISGAVNFGGGLTIGAGLNLGYGNSSILGADKAKFEAVGSLGATYNFDDTHSVGGSFSYSWRGARSKLNQTTWNISARSGEFRFRFEEDIPFNDAYRTGGMELGWGDVSLGFRLYTDDPNPDGLNFKSARKAGLTTDKIKSKMWGYHPNPDPDNPLGSWTMLDKNARSPLYLGIRHGNNQLQIGADDPVFQDFFQNGVHKSKIKFLSTPLFNVYDARPTRFFGQYRSINQFSIY
jgi:RHS repeat-associated protein